MLSVFEKHLLGLINILDWLGQEHNHLKLVTRSLTCLASFVVN